MYVLLISTSMLGQRKILAPIFMVFSNSLAVIGDKGSDQNGIAAHE